MANISTAASGNWSDTATWSGGVLPGSGDTAQILTGHVVTMDQDVTITSLINTGNGYLLFTGATPYSLTATASIAPSVSSTGSMIIFDASYTATGSTINTALINMDQYQGTGSKGAIETLIGSSGSLTINCSGNILGDNNSTGGVSSPAITLGGSINTTIYGARYFAGMIATIDVPTTASCDITLYASNEFANRTIRVSSTGTHLLTLNGNINTTNNYAPVEVVNVNTTVVLNGNVTSTTTAGAGYYGINGTAIGDVTINGDIRVGTTGGVNTTSSSVKNTTINGNVYGGSSTAIALNVDRRNVYITGNVVGGSAIASGGTGGVALNVQQASNVYVYGDVIGGSSIWPTQGGSAITSNNSNNYVYILGNVYAGKNIYASSFGALSMGSSTASGMYILGESGQTTHLYNTQVQLAAHAVPFTIAPGANIVSHYGFYDPDGNFFDLIDPITNADSGLDPSDVRDGVIYDSDLKEGTMAIPDADDVLFGVPVGATTGTAHIKMTDGASVTGSQIATLSD